MSVVAHTVNNQDGGIQDGGVEVSSNEDGASSKVLSNELSTTTNVNFGGDSKDWGNFASVCSSRCV